MNNTEERKMADNQRVHPVVHDPEAARTSPPMEPKPTAPLFPRGSSRSDSSDPGRTRGAPLKRPRRTGCCKRCICWTLCFLLLIIILVAISGGVLYLVFRPRLPSYSIDSMRIGQLNLEPDNSLSAAFNVNMTARNPNRRIGIYYEDGSRLSVRYRGMRLCEGSLPVFYQGHRNTTLFGIQLAGQTSNAAWLLESLQAETDGVPFVIRGRVPVRIKLGRLRLWEWTFRFRCRLTVDAVAANNDVRIRDSRCRFRFRF